ncbi:MAG TPA: vWA domain-containing protein [Anaerolineales bacterium]|nr:vWA domain-containing protein [Anaerolineales bacterium]
MSHVTGTVQAVAPVVSIGPDSGIAPSAPNTWSLNFAHTPAPGSTKLLILHFRSANFPANNRLEVDLGYDTDVFTAADGTDFWTRPINIYVLAGGLVPIRYITNGAATGSVQLDKYGRGEQHAGLQCHPSISNCDPFLKDPTYTEPTYDPFWYCMNPPNWENAACIPSTTDVRARVARSVGMIVSLHGNELTTCSVTLVDADKVISAGHCHTPAEALASSVTFDYQTDCSGARPAGYNPRFYKVKAVVKHGYVSSLDYSLLQLAAAPPGIPVIQMRHDVPAPGEQVFGVHHPNGAVKKLSPPHTGFANVLASNATIVNVPSNFHVSGGSSGSGLFDTAGRIVGVLSNGNPCGRGSRLPDEPCATGFTPTPLNYLATARIVQDLAPAPPPSITRDVMVVFDRSGSMTENDGTGRTKIEAARDALSLFVQLVRSNVGNRVGLVSFSTAASSPADFAIAAVNPANKLTLIGPAPYSGGKVGALMPGGATSIGEGLDAARLQFPSPGTNPRAILLLTDGMQNTPRFVSQVEGALAGIDVHSIGFGTDANLDGALLTALAAAHNGVYTRAESGLALEKFFSEAFGNIFEAGILMDPEYDLPANQPGGTPQSFNVCGEENLTIVAGWDRTDASLLLEVTSPGGTIITGTSPTIESSTGRTWTFLRLPLPYNAERNGVWRVNVVRPSDIELPPPAPQLRYFINIIPGGGARLLKMPDEQRYYTGDVINPLVYLRYADGGWPMDARVQVTVTHPVVGAGNILSRQTLRAPATLDGDTLPARQATLTALQRESNDPIIQYTQTTFDLFDDAANLKGAFEPAGMFGRPLGDLLKMEGNYTFHFQATYGEECTATRELLYSLHVDVGVDPTRTDISTTVAEQRPDGTREIQVTITPRDRYGNLLGPGRADQLSVSGNTGTTVSGPVSDLDNGSYSIPAVWDRSSGNAPGIVIGQPDKPCIVVQDPKVANEKVRKWQLLFWLLLIFAAILCILLLILLFT